MTVTIARPAATPAAASELRRLDDSCGPDGHHAERAGEPTPQPGLMAVPGLVGGDGLVPLRRSAAGPEDRLDLVGRTVAPLRTLRRVVTIGTTPYPVKKDLPDPPAKLKADKKLWPKVNALAKAWQKDKLPHTYTTSDALYEALVAEVNPPQETGGTAKQGGTDTKAKTPKGKEPWPTIYHAVEVEGKVTVVDWNDFEATGAAKLCLELLDAPVQVSSNTQTTACHGNGHKKLPVEVVVPGGGSLASVDKDKQPDYTPYVEFLITGHKKTSGIERGIINRQSGALYLTAHYETGSFVELAHAPDNLVANWKGKAEEYCAGLKG